MDEKRFKDLLFENNKYLIQEMDVRIDSKIKENNKYLIQEMDVRIDSKIKENNEYLFQEMDKMMDKKIFESERRQNQKLAKLEHEYGDKISAIFDKVMSIDEKLSDTRGLSIKNENKLNQHDDMLFSQGYRISKLEEQVYSK